MREPFAGCEGSSLGIWGSAIGFRSDAPLALRLYHSARFCIFVTSYTNLPVTEVYDWVRAKIEVLGKLYRSESGLEPVDYFSLLLQIVDVSVQIVLIVIIVRDRCLVWALHITPNVKLE